MKKGIIKKGIEMKREERRCSKMKSIGDIDELKKWREGMIFMLLFPPFILLAAGCG